MYNALKATFFASTLVVISIFSLSAYSNKPDLGVKIPGGGVKLPCEILGTCPPPPPATQACPNITVNTASLTTFDKTKCFPSTNATPNNTCGLDSAIALADSCGAPATITFDTSKVTTPITLTASLQIIPSTSTSVTLDGGKNRVTIKANTSSLTRAFTISGPGTATVKNLYFSGFGNSPTDALLYLDGTAKGFRLDGNSADNNARIYDASQSSNNAESTIPLFLSVAPDSGTPTFTVFAILTIPADGDYSKILQFSRTSSTSDFITETDKNGYSVYQPLGNPSGSSSLRVTPLKGTNGTAVSDTKVLVEGVLPLNFSDKNTKFHMLINYADKNATYLSGDPASYVDADSDGITDSQETAWGTDSNSLNKPEDFNKFLYPLPSPPNPAGSVALCTDGTKFIDCGSSSLAAASTNQNNNQPGGGNAGTGGCSILVQAKSSNNLTPFVYLSGILLCFGVLAGRRYRLGRASEKIS